MSKQTNQDQLKIYNSPLYRTKIKRMVEMVKTVRGIHGKLPKGKLPPLKATASNKEKEKQAQLEATRLTINTVHYFAHPFSGSRGESAPSTPAPETTTETQS